ncbi:tail fiber domain-containing protein [Akkermansiaceae bacterium]|nr:tail fiber domain-containing protein [Akkermansiaceae bacterium]
MAITKVTRTLLSTGIDDQSNATAITIDSSENVGIGATSPAYTLDVNGNIGVGTTSTGQSIIQMLANTTNGATTIHFGDGGGSSAYVGYINYAHDSNSLQFGTSSTERMRIDSSGNVGIGNTECSDVLHVTKTGTGAQIALRLANEGTSVGDGPRINFTSGTSSEGSSIKSLGTALNKADLALSSGGDVETMRMTSDNDVVIGHTAAVGTTHKGKLQVKSAISILDGSNTTAATLSLYSSGANSAFLSVDPDQEGNDTHFYFYIDGSNKMKLDNNGRLSIDPLDTRTATGALNLLGEVGANYNAIAFRHNSSTVVGTVTTSASATAYNTSSDYRLKENVDYTWDATTRLKQLKPARFNFIADETNTLVDGFIAHEVSSIVPEAITGAKDAVDSDGNPDYQGIDQSKLVPLLVKTIQELEARITTLEG